MCEMEVNPQQRTDVILQAMAHNLSTIDRDLDMLREVVKARKEYNKLASVERTQDLVHRAYADMLMEFGVAVAERTSDTDGHVHTVGNEKRTFVAELDSATRGSRKHETR